MFFNTVRFLLFQPRFQHLQILNRLNSLTNIKHNLLGHFYPSTVVLDIFQRPKIPGSRDFIKCQRHKPTSPYGSKYGVVVVNRHQPHKIAVYIIQLTNHQTQRTNTHKASTKPTTTPTTSLPWIKQTLFHPSHNLPCSHHKLNTPDASHADQHTAQEPTSHACKLVESLH